MRVRITGAFRSVAVRLRPVGALLVALAFIAILGRNLIHAIEVRANISLLRDENAVLAAQAEALTAERILLDDAAFLDLVARGYSLGSSVERPFVLAADAADLPADAPGSAARRLSVEAPQRAPIEAWIEVLFGG